LVYVLGYDAKQAIVMSLLVVGITSLLAAAQHWRLGNVRIPTALMFGAFTMIGAFAGARFAMYLSGGVQLLVLAVVMVAAALSMLRGKPVASGESPVSVNAPRWGVLIPVALGVGVLTGLIGIGGGFLVVPALIVIAHVPVREAIGTSLLVIALNSAAGFAGYLGTVTVDWAFLAPFTAASVGGALVGTALASRVPQAVLKRRFALFLLVMGGFVLFKNRHILISPATVSALPTRR